LNMVIDLIEHVTRLSWIFAASRRSEHAQFACGLRLLVFYDGYAGTKDSQQCVQLAVACGPDVRFLRHSVGPTDSQAAHDGGAR
jgi:hypothetical protein